MVSAASGGIILSKSYVTLRNGRNGQPQFLALQQPSRRGFPGVLVFGDVAAHEVAQRLAGRNVLVCRDSNEVSFQLRRDAQIEVGVLDLLP
jgi:hypothetical protein